VCSVDRFLPDYTAQQPKRQSSSYSCRENLTIRGISFFFPGTHLIRRPAGHSRLNVAVKGETPNASAWNRTKAINYRLIRQECLK
jgi:hypothetical protein